MWVAVGRSIGWGPVHNSKVSGEDASTASSSLGDRFARWRVQQRHKRWVNQQAVMRDLLRMADAVAANSGVAEQSVWSGDAYLREMRPKQGKNGKQSGQKLVRTASGTVSVTTRRVVFVGGGRSVTWDFSRLTGRPNFKRGTRVVNLPTVNWPQKMAVEVSPKLPFLPFLELALAVFDQGPDQVARAYREMLAAHSKAEPILGAHSGNPTAVLPPAVIAHTAPNRGRAGCLGAVAAVAVISAVGNIAHQPAADHGTGPAPVGAVTSTVTKAASSPSPKPAASPSPSHSPSAVPSATPTSVKTPTPADTASATIPPPPVSTTASSDPVTSSQIPPESAPSSITYVSGPVHPGAFCSDEGDIGYTVKGLEMICTTTATDPRDRWRQVR